MKDFTFQNPTKIIFGKTVMDRIRSNVEKFGRKIILTYKEKSVNIP